MMIITYTYDNRKICYGCKWYHPVPRENGMIGLCVNQQTKVRNKSRFATDKKCKQWEQPDLTDSESTQSGAIRSARGDAE